MRNNIHNIYFTHNKSNIVKIYQYDKGQILVFDETFKNGTEVQFANGMTKVIFNQRILIPDIVLEIAGTVKAWIQTINDSDETTVYEIMMVVEPRAKKNDYIQPEDEQSFREEIQQMIETAGKPTPEEIDPIVKDYLEKNPPQAYDDTEIKQEITDINNSLSEKQDKLTAGANITISGNVISASGGGSGTTDYSALSNKPSINNVTLSGNKTLSQLGINNLSTSDVDSRVQTYWNSHKEELKGAKGDDYVITSADYDAIADVVLTKLPSAESEEF